MVFTLPKSYVNDTKYTLLSLMVHIEKNKNGPLLPQLANWVNIYLLKGEETNLRP